MLISQAWAQAAGGGGGAAGGIEQFLPLILIFVVMYFLLFRPQQQKAKRHKELVKNLRRGDRVVTQGGILGTVSKVINEGEVQVELAEGVRVRLLRNAVTEVLAKTAPLADGSGDKDKSKEAGSGSADADTGDDNNDSSTVPAMRAQTPPPAGIVGVLTRLLGGK